MGHEKPNHAMLAAFRNWLTARLRRAVLQLWQKMYEDARGKFLHVQRSAVRTLACVPRSQRTPRRKSILGETLYSTSMRQRCSVCAAKAKILEVRQRSW